MGQYLHLYETEAQFNTDYEGENYKEPWVSYTEDVQRTDYNKTEEERMRETPLTFEILSDGNIVWKASDTSVAKTIEYKKNNDEWTPITSTTGGTSVSVVSGDVIQFRGNNDSYTNSYTGGGRNYLNNSFSGTTCNFNVYGNILSLISGDDILKYTKEEIPTNTRLSGLFKNVTTLINAEKLVLCSYIERNSSCADLFSNCTNLLTPPIFSSNNAESKIKSHCYRRMFENCISLTIAPLLPATALAESCYMSMFNGCSSLTTAPELPATTLAKSCYQAMFQGCSNLTQAPSLPATELTEGCYQHLFSGCSKLNYIKCFAVNISALSCTHSWVEGVASTGTFVKNPSMTSWTMGVSGIPTDWIVRDAV